MTASSSAAVPLHDALHIRFSFLLKVVHVWLERPGQPCQLNCLRQHEVHHAAGGACLR